MVHLRIVAPSDSAGRALELLEADGSVTNVVYLAGAPRKPDGDVILCDVAREDASVVVADLRRLDIPRDGSITLEYIDIQLSASFLAFMVVAMQIAGVGILLDQPILIVGAMVVGPEFGPLAAFSVAMVELRGMLAGRSLAALAAGFPLGIATVLLATLAFRGTGLVPDDFAPDDHPLTGFISQPDFLSFFVAFVAGTAGVLSLTRRSRAP